jgi:hypothetical protein
VSIAEAGPERQGAAGTTALFDDHHNVSRDPPALSVMMNDSLCKPAGSALAGIQLNGRFKNLCVQLHASRRSHHSGLIAMR